MHGVRPMLSTPNNIKLKKIKEHFMSLQKIKLIKAGLMMSVVCTTLLLTACGGKGASTGTINNSDNAAPNIPDSRTAKIYRSNKTPVAVNETTIIKNNDTIKFRFEMRSRKTNKVVDTSPKENIEYKIGNKGEVRLPKALAEAIKNSLIGETYWIYFPKEMQDLPSQYDSKDAYTVKYTVLSKK